MTGGHHSYEGPPEGIDQSWQYFHERPAASDSDDDSAENDTGTGGETVYATDPEPPGTEETVDVPVPEPTDRDPTDGELMADGPGQTTLEDWQGGSA